MNLKKHALHCATFFQQKSNLVYIVATGLSLFTTSAFCQIDYTVGKSLQLNDDSLKITLERGSFNNTLPEYKIKVFENGFVLYEGKQQVDKLGFYTVRLSAEELKEILFRIEASNFFNATATYTEALFSIEKSIMTVKKNKDLKKTVARKGNFPKSIKGAEDYLIDAVINKKLQSVK